MSLLSSGSGVRTSPGRPRTMAIVIDCWRDQPRTWWHRLLSRCLGSTQFLYLNIRRLLRSDHIDLVVISSYDGRPTTAAVMDHGKPQWEILDLWELRQLLLAESVTCIYFCGSAWDSCVRLRPVGWQAVAEMLRREALPIELRVHQRSVKNLDNSYFQPDLEPRWQLIPGLPGHYRLLWTSCG